MENLVSLFRRKMAPFDFASFPRPHQFPRKTNTTSAHFWPPRWPWKHKSTSRLILHAYHLVMDFTWRQMEDCILNPLQFIWVVGNAWRLTNAPATFQRFMMTFFADMINVIVHHIFGWHPQLFQQHFQAQLHIWQVLCRLHANGILPVQINASSMSFLQIPQIYAVTWRPHHGPVQIFKSSKIGQYHESQGYSIFPQLCQLLPSFHL